jgi:hypothetical protein
MERLLRILVPFVAGALAPLGALAQTVGLYDRPFLVVDPGVQTAMINRADVAGRVAVTGSDDKTGRVWSLAVGTPERTIRMPMGPGTSARSLPWRSRRTARPSPLAGG